MKKPAPKSWSGGLPAIMGVLAVIVLFAVFGLWGTMTQISGAIIASGHIEVESERQVVQHLEGGVVGQIHIEEGDAVEAGQVLLQLDGTQITSQLEIVRQQLFEVRVRKARLVAEREAARQIRFDDELTQSAAADADMAEVLDGQRRLFETRNLTLSQQLDRLEERKVQIRNQVTGSQAQISALEQQIELIDLELENQKDLLAKGLTQATRVLTLEREAVSMRGSLGNLQAEIARLNAQIVETDIEALQMQSARQEEAITLLRDLAISEVELTERDFALSQTLSRTQIRAPMTGIVHGLTVHALQSVVRPAEPILYVVPTESPLVISSRIEAIHVDEVRVGQEASLRFSTFDQRTTPEIFGRVTKVSADVFTDDTTGISYYTAEIEPNAGEIERLGDVEVLPGMPVDAFIRTTDRTPLNYLTKPLTDYFNRAFRES